jgi:hypothetical protein
MSESAPQTITLSPEESAHLRARQSWQTDVLNQPYNPSAAGPDWDQLAVDEATAGMPEMPGFPAELGDYEANSFALGPEPGWQDSFDPAVYESATASDTPSAATAASEPPISDPAVAAAASPPAAATASDSSTTTPAPESAAAAPAAEPLPAIPEPTPPPNYNPTARYATEQSAIEALRDPNLDDEGRRLAAGKLVSSKMAGISAEDRAMLQAIANGETGDHVRAFLARGFDKFQQEQTAEAVKTNPEIATNPEAFGSFMGQMQDMWEGLGPTGQIASMIGIPAATFGLMGGNGMSAILGGLGLGALGIGAGAMGYLGEGTQAHMGKALGEVGNFFGVISDDSRNADLLGEAGQGAAKQRVTDAVTGALTEGGDVQAALAAGQAALNAERAKFEPLRQAYQTNPELAYSYLMGMRGNAPKTREQAKALFDQLNSQYTQSGQAGYLEQQIQAQLAQRAAQAVNSGVQAVTGALENPGAAVDGAVNAVRGWLPWGEAPPAAQAPAAPPPGRETRASAKKIWRHHLMKKALSAIDQKELNDLEQWQRTTKGFDDKKVQRLKELQARQAAEFSADKVVKVCMKAARCWAGYEAVPGAKAYSRGSCRPVGSKKTQKEMKNGTERPHEKVKQGGAPSRPQVTNRATQGARAFAAARLGAARY